MFTSQSRFAAHYPRSTRLVNSAERALTSRSATILALTGLAALMAGFRLATTGEAEGDEMFRAWMVDWVVIWASTAILFLWLLVPMFKFLREDYRAERELQTMRDVAALSPNMVHEMQTMHMIQQLRDEQAVEAELAAAEALDPLGGLKAPAASLQAAKAARLGTRLGSAT